MDKKFYIYLRINGCLTFRVDPYLATQDTLDSWLAKGYSIETEHKTGRFITEVYLVAR